ncbi:MAG: histone deacetylase [Myxococcota bacterium]|jgi:acetoin utilization deacetylase AcuC-like enzyme|nr:histone deacetylase [Myxococcota bacterium]
MTTTRRMHVVEDPRFRDHQGPEGHPESPARLLAVGEALTQWREHAPGTLESVAPRAASDAEILAVHTEDHLRGVEAGVKRAPGNLDPDTFVSPASYDVARLAAGSCVDVALRIANGEAQQAFAALRPPGHHAEADRAMGFCLFNGVAIAARALQQQAGIDRILVLDWDVHHGNGTQHSFEGDKDVLYVSTHQFPFYPGTGAVGETGTGMGIGATLNIPMPPGCGDYEYIAVFQHLFAPAALEFDPDFILVSCGFDAHESDPLGSMGITRTGYFGMTQIVREVAETACNGRLAFILEGGYAAQGLAEGTLSVLEAMLQNEPESLLSNRLDVPGGSNLADIVRAVADVHASNFAGITAG